MSTIFVISRLIEAGLPNITGLFNGGDANFAYQLRGTGAFAEYGQWMNATYHADDPAPAGRVYGCNFDASRSSSIYGSSDTVTPKSVTVAFAIRY